MRHTIGTMLDFRHPQGLAAVRSDVALSIAELSRRSGVSRDTIERIEKGRGKWSLRTFEALERAMIETASPSSEAA
jgi:predicted transcriptional regulator